MFVSDPSENVHGIKKGSAFLFSSYTLSGYICKLKSNDHPKGSSHSKKKKSVVGYPLPESQTFLDILGKNLVIFYKFFRFLSEKINSFYQNMFQLMCEKKKSY